MKLWIKSSNRIDYDNTVCFVDGHKVRWNTLANNIGKQYPINGKPKTVSGRLYFFEVLPYLNNIQEMKKYFIDKADEHSLDIVEGLENLEYFLKDHTIEIVGK